MITSRSHPMAPSDSFLFNIPFLLLVMLWVVMCQFSKPLGFERIRLLLGRCADGCQQLLWLEQELSSHLPLVARFECHARRNSTQGLANTVEYRSRHGPLHVGGLRPHRKRQPHPQGIEEQALGVRVYWELAIGLLGVHLNQTRVTAPDNNDERADWEL